LKITDKKDEVNNTPFHVTFLNGRIRDLSFDTIKDIMMKIKTLAFQIKQMRYLEA